MKQVNKFENFSKESNFTDAEYLSLKNRASKTADDSYNDWLENKNETFARMISRTAVSPGFIDFLPIWLEKFKDELLVIDAINSRIK